MDGVFCSDCKKELLNDPPDTSRTPCPYCGSQKRTFTRGIETSISFSSHTMGEHLREDKPIGFTESERPEITRYASLTANGNSVLVNLKGLTPKSEQDSSGVCSILVNALNSEKHTFDLKGLGEQDDDCVIANHEETIGIQVVRALVSPDFWKDLAKQGEVKDLELSIHEAALMLKLAIEYKTSKHKKYIPPEQRPKLILALDAYRVPALALGPVVISFKEVHLTWAKSLSFYAIYIVGPTINYVSRLDA